MTIWKKKRQASGLSKTDMANELGLNYEFYNAIEKGDVKMPSNLIDKFNEIINRGKQNELTSAKNNIDADNFWEEVKQQDEDGTYVLIKKMREFNVSSLKELAELLGYKSVGTIYNYLQGRNTVGPEFKKRLYNFFSNELNIQIPTKVVGKSETGTKRRREPVVNKKLDNYYNKTDFKKILKEHKITNRQIANAIGVHDSTISIMVTKKCKPSYKVIETVKKYLDNILAQPIVDEPLIYPEIPQVEVKLPEIPSVNVKELVPNYFEEEKKQELNGVVERYEKELNEIDDVIQMYNNKIKNLEIRKKICVEVLNVIDELNRIGE